MPLKEFGKYEVLARLATGGAASIFLARQPGAAGFNKLVCLKTLLPERASDTDFVAMFLDEARLAARLNHPNCVQIYDLGRVRGVYYISMEYIFGETLWGLLTTVTRLRTPLPPAHVAAIVAAVCDGLHHAHELKDPNGRPYNLVHRDVSPQNVMISYEGQTKVLDFGIAKAETGRAPTMAGVVKGKFSYMSPEQITGGAVDRRSDVYSLGIVLFECLASRRLYRGDTPEDIARLILEHRAPRLSDVVPDASPALDEICGRALSRHPSRRFQTAQEMGDALRNYLDDLRYAQTSSAIGRLLEERFEHLGERRQVYEQALQPDYDEARLLRILDARQVRDVDLFPDGEAPPVPDFHEETVDEVLHRALNDPTSSSKRRGLGWRVEIESAGDPTPQVGLPEIGRLTSSSDEASTRIDPDALEGRAPDPESATQFEPAHKEPETLDHVLPPMVPAAGLTPEPVVTALGEGVVESTDVFDDKTPLEDTNDLLTALPLEPMGGSVTASIPEVPLREPSEPRLPPRTEPVATVLVEPTRYSLAAVMAALAFGLSVGIVVGMVLARMFFMGAP